MTHAGNEAIEQKNLTTDFIFVFARHVNQISKSLTPTKVAQILVLNTILSNINFCFKL